MIRRFLVFDGDGELVATFRMWEDAHMWAHDRAADPLTSQPIQIEDREDRRTWTLDDGGCRMTVWRRQVQYRYCSGVASDDIGDVTAGIDDVISDVMDEFTARRSARVHACVS
jgi:hypothetical protein